MECAGVFREVLAKKKTTVKEKTTALYQFLTAHEVEEKLRKMQLEFEEERDFAAAKEYEQIYGIVMDLLDKIVDLLGDEQFDITEYADVLDAGFEAAKVGVIPPGYDCVVLGDIERTRLDEMCIRDRLSIYSSSSKVIAAGMVRLKVVSVTYALCGMMDVMLSLIHI